jgi:hypothetical protein
MSVPLAKTNVMKIYSVLLLCVVSASSFGQITSYGSFKSQDQELIYQKIFTQDSVTAEKLNAFYSALPFIANVQVNGSELTFDMNDITVDYRKFQFSQVSTPPVILTGKYTGKVTVGVKDGKYRVTVNAIMFTGDLGTKKVTEKEKLTNYACRNSGTVIDKEWCKPNTLGLLDKAFTDKLQYVGTEKKKDKEDW